MELRKRLQHTRRTHARLTSSRLVPSTPPHPTPCLQTLEREKYLFWYGGPKYHRLMIILPVLIVQLCIGSLYSWSIFNSTMDKVWGTPGSNANAFMMGVAFFGIGTLFMGTWVERNGPFWAVLLTLFLTPAGWALAALGAYQKSYVVTILFGVCALLQRRGADAASPSPTAPVHALLSCGVPARSLTLSSPMSSLLCSLALPPQSTAWAARSRTSP